MKITQDAFGQIKDLHPAGLHAISRVQINVGKFYCDKMTARGLCPMKCEQCVPVIQSIVSTTQTAKARNPYAFLTWSLKNEVANAADKVSKEKTPGPPRNAFGEAEETNPFDTLEAMFDGG